MKQRREPRVGKSLRVKVRGVDRNGNSFSQEAHTIDISRTGARLDAVGCLRGVGDTIEVRRGWRKARFRVVWVGQFGLPEQNQAGISSLEPDKYIWGVALPESRGETSYLPRSEPAPAGASSAASPAPQTAGMHWAAGRRLSARRSLRVDLHVPIGVRWVTDDGATQEKDATTLVVNDHGCMVPLKAMMMEGLILELVNRSSQEVRKAKVIWCGDVSAEGRHQVAIELEEPDPKFWGPAFLHAARMKTLSDRWVG